MIRYYCNVVCVLLLVSVVFICIQAATVQDEKDVRTLLFTTNAYNFRTRPIANQSDALNVNISYYLLSLNELDEVEEVMKTTGYLYLTWIDSELQWNYTSYGDLYAILVPQKEVWKPDVALKNSFTDYKQLGTDELYVYIDSDGFVMWYPMQVFQSTCSIDITYFPFDVHVCEMEFVAWSYVQSEVTLQSDDGVLLSEFQESSSWDILSTSHYVKTAGVETSITFTIKLKRKPLSAMLGMVFPIFVLSILNLFVFVLPCESGEKSGYAVTIFLAFAVFLTIIDASMPDNSTSVAIFSVYIVLMTVQSCLSTMIALAMIRCSTFDEEKTAIPSWLIKVADIAKFKPCRNLIWANRVKNMSLEDIDQDIKVDFDGKRSDDLGKIYKWKQIINGLDVFCFIFFCSFTVLVTIVCLSVSAASTD